MLNECLPEAALTPLSDYVRALRPDLPAAAFAPSTSRVALIPIYFAVIAVAAVAIGAGWLPWPVVPLVSVVIGVAFACLAFVAHEAMHGGIVRGRRAREVVGWLGFLPFTLSPRLWSAWHDRVHHGHANVPGDPDMYATLAEYRGSRKIRFAIDAFALGGRRWRGALSLILGFSIQSAQQLVNVRRYVTERGARIAIAQTVGAIAVWAVVAALVGFVPFLFVYVLPLLIGNSIVMAFILTNHGLSPRVEINDPLVSGLSVTTPRWIEWITLKFGYHVEHHVFPAMSSRHARLVRDLLRAKWPARYQSMSLGSALTALHRTARVYKNATTLVDPHTGQEFATLGSG